jgi:flagellar basal-body rod modification protein FlgD
MQPTDNSEFMAQMAQFSTLEQMQNLNQSINSLMASDTMGKSVVYNTTDADGNATQSSGTVSAVDLTEDTPRYLINDEWIPQSSIAQFYDPSQFSDGSGDGT